jgi:HlyD family secretion protein
MHSFIQKIPKEAIRKGGIWGAVLAVIAIIVVIFINKIPHLQYTKAEKGTVTATVSLDGMVKPSQNVDLAFQLSGKIKNVLVNVGDKVSSGQPLADLDDADLQAQLVQAQAVVSAAKARLDALEQGARPEQITINQNVLSAAQGGAMTAITSAYSVADSAIRNTADEFFSNPTSLSPQFNLPVNDASLKTVIENSRTDMQQLLSDWHDSMSTLAASSSVGDLDAALSIAKQDVSKVNDFMGNIALAVNGLLGSQNIPQATIDGYKASVTGVRTGITTALGALVTAQGSLESASSTLALAQAPLGAANDIAGQQAIVAQAEAAVENINVALSRTVLRSPFDGTVTVQNAKVGQVTGPTVPVISLNSNADFQVEGYASQIDVAGISIGDSADVTLDAYGAESVFAATVTAVDPAQTLIAGIPAYKVTLQFEKNDVRIKAGMTASVMIHSLHNDDVLVVPTVDVLTIRNDAYVLKDVNGHPTLTKVVTGFSSSGDMTEIIAGLKEGDSIVTFTK